MQRISQHLNPFTCCGSCCCERLFPLCRRPPPTMRRPAVTSLPGGKGCSGVFWAKRGRFWTDSPRCQKRAFFGGAHGGQHPRHCLHHPHPWRALMQMMPVMRGMLSPRLGQSCRKREKHSVFQGVWWVRTWNISKPPGRARFWAGISVSNKKHCVLSTCSESASTLILLHVVAHAAAHDLFHSRRSSCSGQDWLCQALAVAGWQQQALPAFT